MKVLKRADQGCRWFSVKEGRERSVEELFFSGEGGGYDSEDAEEEEEGEVEGSGSCGVGDTGDADAEAVSSGVVAVSGLLPRVLLGSLGGLGAVENRRARPSGRRRMMLQRMHIGR
jgi:hypothetical protein